MESLGELGFPLDRLHALSHVEDGILGAGAHVGHGEGLEEIGDLAGAESGLQHGVGASELPSVELGHWKDARRGLLERREPGRDCRAHGSQLAVPDAVRPEPGRDQLRRAPGVAAALRLRVSGRLVPGR